MGKIDIKPYPKQEKFFLADTRYIAYGGARGGGKSWAARTKAMLLALGNDGLQILLVRRTLTELRENHIIPLAIMLEGIAKYSSQNKEFIFPNGSRIVLGYCKNEMDVLQYQGQAYDVIFLEEATHFSEFQFNVFMESNRMSGMAGALFKPRMYLTCNPGGVGHAWVKRLFVDKEYRNKEKKENYTFIQSLVFDNEFIVKNNPEYIENLENLPEMRRRAMLFGDWDAFEGQFFPEFTREVHVVEPFEIPSNWFRFLSLDYGMDMTACYWWAVDPDGFMYAYRELHQPSLILSEAAQLIDEMCLEPYSYITASPDLWNRRQETGKSGYEIMTENGLHSLRPAGNSRIPGWRMFREYLKPVKDRYGNLTPKLMICANCTEAIKSIPQLQYHETILEDASSNPHEITHAPESIRYAVMSRPQSAEEVKPVKIKNVFIRERNEDFIGIGAGDKVIEI